MKRKRHEQSFSSPFGLPAQSVAATHAAVAVHRPAAVSGDRCREAVGLDFGPQLVVQPGNLSAQFSRPLGVGIGSAHQRIVLAPLSRRILSELHRAVKECLIVSSDNTVVLNTAHGIAPIAVPGAGPCLGTNNTY